MSSLNLVNVLAVVAVMACVLTPSAAFQPAGRFALSQQQQRQQQQRQWQQPIVEWSRTSTTTTTALAAGGKGFGKDPPPAPKKKSTNENDSGSGMASADDGPSMGGFQSVESGGSDAIPQMETRPDIDPSVPAEERAKRLLREKYGLQTLEEQRMNEARLKNRAQMEEWKEMAAQGEDFDIIAALPEPVLVGIDRFLKIGLAITTTLFIGAGIGITAEAWSAASGNALPENIDNFIVGTVEPYFTPGLGVLLAFSVSLGLFASAQLASGASVYNEADPKNRN